MNDGIYSTYSFTIRYDFPQVASVTFRISMGVMGHHGHQAAGRNRLGFHEFVSWGPQREGREVDGDIIYIYTYNYDLEIKYCCLLCYTICSFMIYYHNSSVSCFIWSNWMIFYLWCFVLLHSIYIYKCISYDIVIYHVMY